MKKVNGQNVVGMKLNEKGPKIIKLFEDSFYYNSQSLSNSGHKGQIEVGVWVRERERERERKKERERGIERKRERDKNPSPCCFLDRQYKVFCWFSKHPRDR